MRFCPQCSVLLYVAAVASLFELCDAADMGTDSGGHEEGASHSSNAQHNGFLHPNVPLPLKIAAPKLGKESNGKQTNMEWETESSGRTPVVAGSVTSFAEETVEKGAETPFSFYGDLSRLPENPPTKVPVWMG